MLSDLGTFSNNTIKKNNWWSCLWAKALSTLKAFRSLTIQFPNQYFINWIEVQCSLLIKKVWLSSELTFSFSEFQAGRWAIMLHLAFTNAYKHPLHTDTHTYSHACSSLDCFCVYGPFYDQRASNLERRWASGDFPRGNCEKLTWAPLTLALIQVTEKVQLQH